MAKESKGEYKEFRTLLRCGIGTRTQKAFAEEINVSKEHLNRILNNREISRPSAALLKKMAAHMKTVTEQKLLESCGYEVEAIEDRAKRFEVQLADGLSMLSSGEHSHPWKSVEDAIRTVEMLYMEENVNLTFGEEEPCNSEDHRWAEKKLHFSYGWGDGENICSTGADIYYSRTENGNIIFMDHSVDKTKIQTKEKAEKLTAEARLLKAIFGNDDEKKVITTDFGYGFYYPATPDGFTDFLCEHRGTFCTNKNRSRMLLDIIDEGKDPDEVFAGFESDRYGLGTGGAVAEILSREFGMYFYNYERDELLSEEDSRSCIMVEGSEVAKSGRNMTAFLLELHHIAEVLKLPQFGHIYCSYTVSAQEQLYDTATFGYEFKEINNNHSD